MAPYSLQAAYTPLGWAALLKNPQHRLEAITPEGGLAMFTRRLDLEDLLGEGRDEPQAAAHVSGEVRDP